MAKNDPPPSADFIGRVVGDAKNPPAVRMLTGWLGASGEENYSRLYTDAELSAYVDIPSDAILYTEPIRDVQPAGGVMVWVKSDAVLKAGGSAASRAARFLQGQVQQDFAKDPAAIGKAGFRCVTEVPCGEPTGFSGLCTNAPQMGGAWPCFTAPPHCFEPTGFTGKCTPVPWPNPTEYVGCTIYHCPTNDLTQNPRICRLIETHLPNCPPAGADVDPQRPPTSLEGCGYTKSWGLCDTRIPNCPPQTAGCPVIPTQTPGCSFSKNPICTDLPGCATNTAPPRCIFITRDQACGVTKRPGCGPLFAQAARFGVDTAPIDTAPAPVVQPQTVINFNCAPSFSFDCQPSTTPDCNPSAIDACPTIKICVTTHCDTAQPTSLCTQFAAACPTKFAEVCPTQPPNVCPTQSPNLCTTACGEKCQSQQLECTKVGCLTHVGPACPNTVSFPDCPQPTVDPNQCPTIPGPLCPDTFVTGCPPSQFGVPCPTNGGPQCPSVAFPCPTDTALDCTFTVTLDGANCPTQFSPNCQSVVICQQTVPAPCTINVAQPFAAARQQQVASQFCPRPTIWTQIGPRCFPTVTRNINCLITNVCPTVLPFCAR
ncbi:MAG: hypothetical protein QOI24_1748 [Acidobacteriota bacterium]|jgi:hypothetical protein|nr:hypothetical protein [Acidobacteriota bacterium]